MKIEEIMQYMSKSYLHRIIDSFTKDFPKQDEHKSISIILKNSEEITDLKRIKNALKFDGIYSNQLLIKSIIEVIINKPNHQASEEEIIEEVQKHEKLMIEKAKSENALYYENKKNVEIFTAILEVALEDYQITNEELKLLKRLQNKLELSDKTLRIILAQLNHFPKTRNELHSLNDFKEVLLSLQRKGILFYCNKLENGIYIIPEEIVSGIRQYLNLELSQNALRKMLIKLPKTLLSKILSNSNLPKSGKIEELIDRIIESSLKPSSALNSLSNDDLYKICTSLPGVKSSGTKDERIYRIIDYFANLIIKEIPSELSKEEKYYNYIVELAHRDREILLANNIITKDIEIDNAFEIATKYLFTNKLGIKLIEMPGTEHPDGCMKMRRSSNLLMWDNKSKETVYNFPESHIKQFKRYIRDSVERVSCFLIIVPEIGENIEFKAQRLKAESNKDTDVAIITAENLLWVAKSWNEFSKTNIFDPEIFNYTGILNRQIIEQRMKLFLK